MRIVIVGAGMQGSLYGARLAHAGHELVFIARGRRAEELRRDGAVIENALTGRRATGRATVANTLDPGMTADLCLVTVRRSGLNLHTDQFPTDESPQILEVVVLVGEKYSVRHI